MWNSGYINYTIIVVHTISFIDVELTTPGGVHWRKSTRKSPVSGSVLKGHRSSCPAQGLITQTNHTSMNYKYYLVWAFQGMTSSLQSKVPPQNSGATGLCVPLRYTLFKVSAQLVCSWLPYSMHESETPVTSTRQYLEFTQLVSFSSISNWRHQVAGIGRKVPDNGPFRDPFFFFFWGGEGGGGGARVASCSAQRQITHTNHTSMNYKYCLFYICEGMTSPLQSKVPPQRSCATGLGVPFQYTLFKVSAQLVCSWLPLSIQ